MTSRNRFSAIIALTDTDAYKLGHKDMYPKGTTGVLTNFTNRGSRIERITHTVHFGLQAFLQSWAMDAWEPFWEADEDEVAALYEEFVTSVLGPNTVGSDHIRSLHRLGYLPLKFCGLPEGTLVPLRVPTFTVENTLPEFYWLVNYIETVMSASIWQPSTSATLAHDFRLLLDEWAIKTTGSTEGVEFQGHDFSFRGMAGPAAAAASGAGHLLSFKGSDNLNVINFVNENYDGDNGLILGSVPATEHSVSSSFGPDDELAYFESILDANPTGIVSAVSDTYDFWKVLTEVLPKLKDRIMAREGKLVIRPDSGDPADILTGLDTKPYSGEFGANDAKTEENYRVRRDRALHGQGGYLTPPQKGAVEILWDIFGGTEVKGADGKTYRVLDSHIGLIYGDSITRDRADDISRRLGLKKFASTNVVFGIGSFTYQYVTRDTFASAFKATWMSLNGEGKAIYKDPITDNGTKKSARGRIAVVDARGDGVKAEYKLYDGADGERLEYTDDNALKLVWEDGEFVARQSFDDIRKVLASQR